MTDQTTPVRFTVTALDPVHGGGRLLALATVSVDLDGVPLTLHGLQVVRQADGKLLCRAPHYRDQAGRWLPAVTLPPELEVAIGGEILAAFLEAAPC